MDEIKTIFFDMGNTLLHFHYGQSDYEKDIHGLIHLTRYLNKFNSNIEFDQVKQGFYEIWIEGIKERQTTFVEYPIENFLNNFLQEYEVVLTLDQCIEAINLFYTEYINQLYFEQSICDTLKSLKDKGYKIGIISNTCYYDEVMKECFKKANIYDLIDSFTFSYSLRIGKPKAQIFRVALNNMKISPKEAVMVGDSLEKDIKPASDLGMKTIWLNNKINTIESLIKPNIQVSCLAELTKYL